MTKARDIADFKFENITDTGTEGTKVASGTTAQRGSTAGQIRFNTTTNLAEYYTGTEFKAIDAPPVISSIDVTNVQTDLGGNETFVITGSLFDASATVKFRDNNGVEITPDTTTRNSASQMTVVKTRSSFSNANEPYDIIVTNPSGLSATLDDQINVDNSPTWTTASGSLGNVYEGATASLSATATDPENDTISYSVQSGSLPSGLSLNSSTGAITGTAPTVSADTTSNFTLRATSNSLTADRAFSITTKDTLEKDSNTLAFFDFANSGRSFTSGSTTATDLSGRGKNLPFGSAYHSSTDGTLIGSSTQNTRATGLIGSIAAISMGCWVKITNDQNKGIIYYGDTSTNNHFFVRNSFGSSPYYKIEVGKDVNGSDIWTPASVSSSQTAQSYITGTTDYTNKYWYLVFRCASNGDVSFSINKSTFYVMRNCGVSMSGHSSGQFGLFGDPYNDNASSHSIGVAWWYSGLVPQALSDQVYDQYASRFGY